MSTVPDAAVAFANRQAQADAAAASGIFGMVLLGLFILAIVGTSFFLYRSRRSGKPRQPGSWRKSRRLLPRT